MPEGDHVPCLYIIVVLTIIFIVYIIVYLFNLRVKRRAKSLRRCDYCGKVVEFVSNCCYSAVKVKFAKNICSKCKKSCKLTCSKCRKPFGIEKIKLRG